MVDPNPANPIRPGQRDQGPFINWGTPAVGAVDAVGVALPAAGAFTDQAYTLIPQLARRMNVMVAYSGGAGSTNGQARYRLEWQIEDRPASGQGWIEPIVDGQTALAITQPYARAPAYALEILGPRVAAGVTLGLRLFTVDIPSLATGYRLLAAELGDTTHPGSLLVTATTSNEI